MAGDRNHYERTFSGLLLERGRQALAINDARRPVLRGRELKNFDFLINGARRVWAVDLKGRRGSPWITRGDLFSMMGWRSIFDGRAEPAFVFAFFEPAGQVRRLFRELDATRRETPAGVYYLCLLEIQDAQRLARPRSARWGTFGFERAAFKRHAYSLERIFDTVGAPRGV